MKWLVDVLAEASSRLVLHHPDDREVLAEAILEAIPKRVLVGAIKSAAAAVLKVRGIHDAAGDLARELANNSAQTVLVMLQVDSDPDNELAIPEAVAL